MRSGLVKISEIPVWLLPACFVFYLIVNMISWDFPFFWDSLLTSTVTTWFYENGWHGGIPPSQIDAGHPPLFYGYLLGWWKLMGRSLLFSHLAMLPFLWITIYQFVQISRRLFSRSHVIIVGAGLFCIETTILAQSTMISYDTALLCFYLIGLRYIIDRRRIPVGLAAAILCMISLRGVVAAFALMATEFLLMRPPKRTFLVIVKYLPAFVLFALWNLWHARVSGWILTTPSDSWSQHRGWVSAAGLAKNAMSIVRVHLEPGRLLLYALTAIGLLRYFLLPGKIDLKPILTIVLVPFLAFSLFFLPFTNPISHRYFMIVFALSIWLFMAIIQHWKRRKLACIATALFLISGHFWIYPHPISMGWEASLSHVPYFKAQKKMNDFLEANLIESSQIAAHFPSDVSHQQSHLSGKHDRPVEIEWMNGTDYVLHSNISNDFTNDELKLTKDRCRIVHKVRNKWVCVSLYDCWD